MLWHSYIILWQPEWCTRARKQRRSPVKLLATKYAIATCAYDVKSASWIIQNGAENAGVLQYTQVPLQSQNYVLLSPNVDYKSNVIIFLPNTNLNNIRAMSLISVFFFFSKTEHVQSKITDGWYGHGHFFVRMLLLSVLPIFSSSASYIWSNWSQGVGEIAPHISICQWSQP